MATPEQGRIERRLAAILAAGMGRREFMAFFGGAAANWPLAVRAQQAGKAYRIGWLSPYPVPGARLRAFKQYLRELDYVEGKNLIIEYRWGDGNFDQLPAMAAELVRLNLDIIISGNTAALLALQKATQTIPIVMLGPSDPLAVGLVGRLDHPGGNITGVSQMALELSGKRLELLKEMVPKLTRVAVLTNPSNPAVVLGLQETRTAAKALDLDVDGVDVHEPGELERALSITVGKRPGALVLLVDQMIDNERARIAAFAIEHQLPSISPFVDFAEAGGLMAYGVSLSDGYRRAVGLIDKILQGAKPANLPVEQPTKFHLIINLKTAKALGLTVPPSLLARVDEVLE